VFAVGIFSVYRLFVDRFSKQSVGDALMILAGAATVACIVFAQLAATGALTSFLSVQIDFVLKVYSQARIPFPWSRIPRALVFVLPIGAALIGLFMCHEKRGHQIGMIFSALALFGVMHFLLQGQHWPYHLYPAVVFSIAADGVGYSVLRASSFHRLRCFASVICCIAVATAIGYFVIKKSELLEFADWKPPGEVAAIQRDLKSLGEAGRVVQPVDTSTLHAMYLAGSRSPTRFIYALPLFLQDDSGYIKSLRAELIDGLRSADYPPVILNTELSTRLAPLNAKAAGTDLSSWWPEFVSLLATEYQIYDSESGKNKGAEGYAIYLRKNFK
jgi:hypothetical protein